MADTRTGPSSLDPFQLEQAKRRFEERLRARARNLRLIREGHPLQADTPERVQKFLARRGFSNAQSAEFLRGDAESLMNAAVTGEQAEPLGFERVLGTNNLMGVAFLEAGLRVARTVGRVWVGIEGGTPVGFGTGFMISPRLLLTNHHVLGDKALAIKSRVEFDYQVRMDGTPAVSTTFAVKAGEFHCADRSLDYAVVAIEPMSANGQPLSGFGWNPMIEEEGKAIVSQWINIIQHPNAEPKQLALRENQLVDVFDAFLHYLTDTSPGSSGSPLFNDRWEIIGLHHSGVVEKNAAGQTMAVNGQVWRPEMGEKNIKWKANEGIRISRILAHLRTQKLNADEKRLLDEMFSAPPVPPIEQAVARQLNGPQASAANPPENPRTQVAVCADGVATWTIPLSVSVRLGGLGTQSPLSAVPSSVPAVSSITAPSPAVTNPQAVDLHASSAAPDEILAAAKRELGSRPDVVRVRLGYVFKDGWITKDQAVVVTVAQRRSIAELRNAKISALPEQFRGLPVEVTGRTIEDLVSTTKGPVVSEALLGDSNISADEILYKAPAGASLAQVTERMRVIAHVSPDAGWANLERFLAKTKKRMVIGMYDFGAPHIVDAVEQMGQSAGFKKLTLAIQPKSAVGTGTKSDDLSDEQTVDRLSRSLGTKFEHAWVKIGRVNGWVASSYHIKVAVRDSEAFWLSSGNMQSSNQPNEDPLADPKPKWLRTYNREWHAIVEHAGLAQTYEKFLLNDFKENLKLAGHEALEGMEMPDVLIPESVFLPKASEAASQIKYFQPYDDDRDFTVTPLLTPDNYHAAVIALINSANSELLIQNQTFNAATENQTALREILDAVLARQRAGVDVKIIFRVLIAPKARETLEQLQDFGFDADSIRVQKNCHTKGIVVDRKRVMLGSQNISSDGVSVNRDASLLFEDKPLAEYFGKIFDHDWRNLATQNIGNESLGIELAVPGQPTPEGMVRLAWNDYLELR